MTLISPPLATRGRECSNDFVWAVQWHQSAGSELVAAHRKKAAAASPANDPTPCTHPNPIAAHLSTPATGLPCTTHRPVEKKCGLCGTADSLGGWANLGSELRLLPMLRIGHGFSGAVLGADLGAELRGHGGVEGRAAEASPARGRLAPHPPAVRPFVHRPAYSLSVLCRNYAGLRGDGSATRGHRAPRSCRPRASRGAASSSSAPAPAWP